MVDLELLEGITQVVEYRELVDKMLYARVYEARKEGATWEQLGYALGTSHQAARKRFKKVCENGKALVEPSTVSLP